MDVIKLSVITINYNNLEGLKCTYDSVVSQTCQDFEWIVIDGGSTDGSREFIERHKEKFTYWCSEPDKGIYHAMNKGIAKAHGWYLNFMNSGDCYYDKWILENVMSQDLSADLVYGDWVETLKGNEILKKSPMKGFNVTVYVENVCHQSMFIRTGVMKEKGYDEKMKVLADWKRWIEMSLDGCTFKYIPYIISRIETEKGVSRHITSQWNDEYRQLLAIMPDKIRCAIARNEEMETTLFKYECNPLIKETIRIALQGKSFKTKMLHFCIYIIKFIERLKGGEQ